jgi:hypothetical protein
MWLAVTSLAGLALTSAVSSVASWSMGSTGWTFYTPYAPSQSLELTVIQFCSYADTGLWPMAALSAAAYILLLERDLRRMRDRGFPVETLGPPAK